jgi:hypothetical protein
MFKQDGIFLDPGGRLRDGWGAFLFTIGLLVAALVIALLIFWVCVVIGWHMSAISCHNWGQINHLRTRWVTYQYWDRSCIANVRGNVWLPTNQIHGFVTH